MPLPQPYGIERLRKGSAMNFPERKSPRIPGYDYATPNYYFVTICTHEKVCLFGKPNQLNQMGQIAKEHLRQIPCIYPAIKLDKYVVMPNHVHAILIVEDSIGNKDLISAVGQYKMSVTKRIRSQYGPINVWQRSFHDHVIRNQRSYEKIWLYIEDNPRKWEDDCFYMKCSDDER